MPALSPGDPDHCTSPGLPLLVEDERDTFDEDLNTEFCQTHVVFLFDGSGSSSETVPSFQTPYTISSPTQIQLIGEPNPSCWMLSMHSLGIIKNSWCLLMNPIKTLSHFNHKSLVSPWRTRTSAKSSIQRKRRGKLQRRRITQEARQSRLQETIVWLQSKGFKLRGRLFLLPSMLSRLQKVERV